MNGFKKFIIKDSINIKYKILNNEESLEPSIEVVLSSLDQNIMKDSECKNDVYYVKFNLTRTEWAEKQGYTNHALVENDFKEALAEFNSDINWVDYISPVNIYLVQSVRESIF